MQCLQRAFYFSQQHSGPPETWFSRKLKGTGLPLWTLSPLWSCLLSSPPTPASWNTEPIPPQGLCSGTLFLQTTNSHLLIVCSDSTFSIEPTLTTLLHLVNVPSQPPKTSTPILLTLFSHLLFFFYSIYHLLIHYTIYFLFACIVWHLTLSFWNISSMRVGIVFVWGGFSPLFLYSKDQEQDETQKKWLINSVEETNWL